MPNAAITVPMATGEPETKQRIFFTVLLWALAYLPAIVILGAVFSWRVNAPYHDSWAFVEQYQDFCHGSYGWKEWLAPHNAHPSAVGKAIYFAVMRVANGEVGLLPLFSWMLSLVISGGVLLLSRPLWRGDARLGARLMFLANLCIFTAVQGHGWLWDFVFQNFIPGTCLVLGLLFLGGERTTWWRWVLAALSALVAVFSFGTGFVVGFLLLPSVGMALGRCSFPKRLAVMLLWAGFCGASGWAALNAFGPTGGGSSPADLLSRPWASFYYMLSLFGHTLGRGTAVDPVTCCALWGAALLVTLMSCAWALIRARDKFLLARSWPWISFCLWAALNAAAICVGRFHATFETGLAHRYATFMLFMPLGVLMLVVTMGRFGVGDGIGKWIRKFYRPALALLVAAQLLNWVSGFQAMELFHRRMVSRKASLDFLNVLQPVPTAFWHLEYSEKMAGAARFLMEHHRLPDVVFAQDATIKSFNRNSDLSSKWANWRLLPAGDAGEEMRGVCGLSKDVVTMPDLLLITAAAQDMEERVVALVPPEPPEDFFVHGARRREFYEHYFGWRWPVDRSLLPVGKEVTLRAYAYDGAKRKVRLIPGNAVLAARQP